MAGLASWKRRRITGLIVHSAVAARPRGVRGNYNSGQSGKRRVQGKPSSPGKGHVAEAVIDVVVLQEPLTGLRLMKRVTAHSRAPASTHNYTIGKRTNHDYETEMVQPIRVAL